MKYQPIIVGGMGGSGTRAVAQILKHSGVYMGSALNAASDALLFSAFGNPHRVHWSYKRMKPYIRLFEKLHLRQGISLTDTLLLAHSFVQSPFLRKHKKAVFSACRKQTDFRAGRWGWKNPPNQYFLSQLNAHYPQCFYIHVIRHGLDMAFSTNTNQLQRYGNLMGIIEDAPLPVRQLALWIKTNEEVRAFAGKHMPGRHAIIYLEELCKNPHRVISDLFDQLDLQTHVSPDQLALLVQMPDSSGRFLREDLTIFTSDQLKALHRIGYHTASPFPHHVQPA